ncbi:helix-turn-helix transcriptional regulator [Catenuloplanes japonicus]|uniref:helix-turn-helix transcriptional regulator n=1 Tax=Catenuloplanes japonicus TaxID=33876 RepID=UPI0005242D54|nr:YafY family protein [Catenuloplanes japonicus]
MPKTSARLLAMLSLLQARRDWPGALLADRLEISPRTVRRDVDRLRELGYPIATIKGPDGGYRLGAGTELPPLLFDDEQAVALTVALQVAAGSGGGIGDAAGRALNTVRQVMPTRLRHRIDTVRVTSVARPAPEVDGAVLVEVSTAVRRQEVLRFDYGEGVRRAEPHHVVTRYGRWYLVAWDLDKDDWRTFRIDRMTPRTPTGPRFTPRAVPGGDVAAFVTARFQGSDTGWQCRGEVILDKPAARVAEFAGDAIVEALGPDRCRMLVGSWSWPAMAATLGRFEAEIEVVGPPELRDAFAQLAHRFARTAGVIVGR